MLKMLKTLNKQKGTSVVELMMIVATASLVIGGFSVKAEDILGMAGDTQRVANLRQMTTALELYYSDYQTYPEVFGDSSETRFEEFISKLAAGNYLASFPTAKENYDYQDLGNGEGYVLRALLENTDDSSVLHLESDWDGMVGGLDCNDPYYCIRM